MNKTPNDLVQVSIFPRSEKDGERLELAIRSIAKRNPSSARTDRESSSALLTGASQADIDAKVDTIKRICGIDCKVGPPPSYSARRSQERSRSTTRTRSTSAAPASSPARSWLLRRTSRATVLNSSRRSSVAPSRPSTFPPLKMD
ncbi:hypothetical protein HFO06_34635 [Rhizobium leguminosarum]|nr:hypothetical protein [Rhizobium leguminosarum]